jgi:hypothetical protein
VSVLKRHPSAQWGPQLQEYLVSVDARNENDAIRRVEAALLGQGNYDGFSAAIRSLR